MWNHIILNCNKEKVSSRSNKIKLVDIWISIGLAAPSLKMQHLSSCFIMKHLLIYHPQNSTFMMDFQSESLSLAMNWQAKMLALSMNFRRAAKLFPCIWSPGPHLETPSFLLSGTQPCPAFQLNLHCFSWGVSLEKRWNRCYHFAALQELAFWGRVEGGWPSALLFYYSSSLFL